MKIIYAGDTAKFSFTIRYGDKVLVPNDLSHLFNCEIVLFSRMDSSKILGHYSLYPAKSEEPSKWKAMTADDKEVQLFLEADVTKASIDNELMMQITNYIVDAELPGDIAIETGTSPLFKIKSKIS